MAEQNTPKMTHDEMIDVLKGLVFGTFDRTTAKEREALDMAISALSAPSANVISIDQANAMIKSYVSHYEENKGEWIPVSEWLPEDYDRVLITVNSCRGLIVREARYHKARNEFEVLHNHDRWEVGEKGLLAWQPLPEPYKAEKGGE